MRIVYGPSEIESAIHRELFPEDYKLWERQKELIGNLALPSYVHGYALAIQYMYNWFENKFEKDFFRGGIYIDGKNVLDDYKRLNEYSRRNIVKGQNPRARMAPSIRLEYDRDGIDLYQAPPEVYLRRSRYQDAFFKDYERNIFLGYMPRALRMEVNYKVRLNSRSEQLDTFNKMELNFRVGSTQAEYISADYHVPKFIMLNIAEKAGFKVVDGEVEKIKEFLEYLNRHSDLTFLFKLRGINLKTEYFIRVNDLYTHVSILDKLDVDNGERDGKLDFNFHVEMNTILTMPIPHYFAYYSAEDITMGIPIHDEFEGCVSLYSINNYKIPKVDDHGWMQGSITDYITEKGDEDIDISSIINGDNPLTRSIKHDYNIGVSPSHFINVILIRDWDSTKLINFHIDWENMRIIFDEPAPREEMIHIVIYFDRGYINELEDAREHMSHGRLKIDDEKKLINN